jgi:transglutaminase-like putative cysteine protease
MQRALGAVLVLALAPAVGEAQQAPTHALLAAPARRVETTYTYETRQTRWTAREWVVCAARAPELPGQVNVVASLEPGGQEGEDLSDLRQPLLVARIPAQTDELKSTLKATVKTQATLIARRLIPFQPSMKVPEVAPLTDSERKLALAVTRRIDHDARAFQKWLDAQELRRDKREEPEIDFAARVFRTITKNFTYKRPYDHDGKATSTCKARIGDCGCLCAVFVAALRANGIPARGLVGRLVVSAKPFDQCDYGEHVRAEFFAAGVGWVPVDPTNGLRDRSARGLEFFGQDRGDFLVLHLEGDLAVDARSWGKAFAGDARSFGKRSLKGLQGVVFWTKGEGTFDDKENISEDWQVRRLPLDKRQE